MLSKEEGGRHKPFFTGYKPQFYVRTTDVTGTIKLPEDVKMVMPGDTTEITVELLQPVAMEEGVENKFTKYGYFIPFVVVYPYEIERLCPANWWYLQDCVPLVEGRETGSGLFQAICSKHVFLRRA